MRPTKTKSSIPTSAASAAEGFSENTSLLILGDLKIGRRRHRLGEFITVPFAKACELIRAGLAIASSPPCTRTP